MPYRGAYYFFYTSWIPLSTSGIVSFSKVVRNGLHIIVFNTALSLRSVLRYGHEFHVAFNAALAAALEAGKRNVGDCNMVTGANAEVFTKLGHLQGDK